LGLPLLSPRDLRALPFFFGSETLFRFLRFEEEDEDFLFLLFILEEEELSLRACC